MSRLDGRVAVVTGAGRGIGRAVALALAREGCRVVGVARTEADLLSLAGEAGPRVVPFAGDVTEETRVRAAFDAALALGPVTIVVCAAGVAAFGPTAEQTLEQWHAVMKVNLLGVFLVCREALRVMKTGHIVNIGSVAGHTAFPDSAAYCASKWGVAGLTKSLAAEVRAHGRNQIHVALVSPGSVDTGLWDGQTWSPSRADMMQPEDVAHAVLGIVAASHRVTVDEVRLMPSKGIL